MLLQALYELSQREGLVPDAGYAVERTHYVMRLSPKGEIVSFGMLLQKISIPQAGSRCSNIAPKFFVENTKYVLGLGGKPKDTKAKEAKRLVRLSDCFKAFYDQVDQAVVNTKDPAAQALALFGQRVKAWKAAQGRTQPGEVYSDLDGLRGLAPERENPEHPDGWTGSEVILIYLGDEVEPMFQHPALRKEWARLRLQSETGRRARCLITGKIAPVLPKHFPIKGLPGAQSSGAFMCCYDKEAFTGRGAVQGENASISREGGEGYVAALHWLLERTETRQHRWGVRVGDQTTLLAWSAVKSQFVSDLFGAISPDPGTVLQYPVSAWSGMAPAPIDETTFFGAILSANASRVVVRDFIDLSIGELKRNVMQYFEDMKIGSDPQPISLWLIQHSLNLQRSADAKKGGTLLPGILANALMQAILRGTPYPPELLDMALNKLRDPSVNGRTLDTCCAVIKAVLLRLPPGRRMEVTVSLDETNTQMPYLLGRLFAVLERLQKVALPEINTSMRDKHFAAAMQMPANTYPELLALSSHHFSKTENVRQGRGRWLERIKGQIFSAMSQSFPARLLPTEQGLWMIGYYQQRESLWTKKAVPTTPAPVPALPAPPVAPAP